ncbi:transpeptidase penicillin-binding protein 2B [Lacticaseibacillus pantheris DSM 15945 = JCM 12539 = NBRC 106106]|uniref:Transpeptidase penicillin-binding protein 2B n=1 Tax=Lacticaseibacillus pantheris DSM 15945 = JCM 12539 = NBRC 106106 TaxID=1423783 RepID=A0A0R1U2N3_9LACO|nr:transpeptidase penicillin-binding protein 2B [Lacticaseibacillus pantheris DSM 15945 = JCM 12539 = NBRC 106106]
MNLLFFFVFVLFALLVGQLAYLQIINGSSFSEVVNSSSSTTVEGTVPRGMIYDSEGRVMVSNKANKAITYTKNESVTSAQMEKVATVLATYINADTSSLTKRQELDYYLANKQNLKRVNKQLTKAQLKLGATKLYKLELKAAKKIMPSLSSKQKTAAAIYYKMNSASEFSTVYLKETGVTSTEVAQVGEHLSSMPGVNLGTDWTNSYPNGKSMLSIIGSVSTSKQGLPEDSLSAYLTEGYSRNDRVGTSYLQKQYEDVLKGSKSQTKVTVNSNNSVTSAVQQYAGSAGENLNLTLDSKFQGQVADIVKKYYQSAVSSGAASLSDGAYAVVMNPSTGAVLAMTGYKHNFKKNTITENALGTINQTFVMGSVVKPAMVLGALEDGVITTSNSSLPDVPIYLKGTPVKKSWYNIGAYSSLTADHALEISSNIYMMRLAMREGNAKYEANSYLTMDNDIFSKMRRHFGEFGLGIKTGIDLPGEVTGLEGATHNSYGALAVGSALDLSYGNYDAYTTMQLADYVSTVANDGYRMRPYLVQSITDSSKSSKSKSVLSTTQPEVLGKIGATQADVNLVKQGMWMTVHGSDSNRTVSALNDLNPGVAAKSGTAQTFAHSDPTDSSSPLVETTTISLVAFAPAKNPQIAVALVIPNLTSTSGAWNTSMAHDIIESYYKLHNVKEDSGYSSSQATING